MQVYASKVKGETKPCYSPTQHPPNTILTMDVQHPLPNLFFFSSIHMQRKLLDVWYNSTNTLKQTQCLASRLYLYYSCCCKSGLEQGVHQRHLSLGNSFLLALICMYRRHWIIVKKNICLLMGLITDIITLYLFNYLLKKQVTTLNDWKYTILLMLTNKSTWQGCFLQDRCVNKMLKNTVKDKNPNKYGRAPKSKWANTIFHSAVLRCFLYVNTWMRFGLTEKNTAVLSWFNNNL